MHLIDGRLYVMGGYGGRSSLTSTAVFDSTSGNWLQLASMSVPKTFFASVVIDGFIYTIGNQDGEDGLAVIERYDVEADKWEVILRSNKLPRTHLAAAAVGPLIYIIGGFPATQKHVHVFDTRKGELGNAPMLHGFVKSDHFHYVAVVGGNLHVLGGIRFEKEGGTLDVHWMFDGQKWHKRSKLPVKSLSKIGAFGVINEKLYLFSKAQKLHHVYNPALDIWSTSLSPMPQLRLMCASVVDGTRLYVFGGMNERTRDGKEVVLIYDAKENSWQNRE
jgi:N-acetylneuraminic acid mutarotase